jgi:hypothetical protein
MIMSGVTASGAAPVWASTAVAVSLIVPPGVSGVLLAGYLAVFSVRMVGLVRIGDIPYWETPNFAQRAVTE